MLRRVLSKLPTLPSRTIYTTNTQQSNSMHSNPALNHLVASIEQLCPLSLADKSWDNVGLMIESPVPRKIEVGLRKKVVCCIDLTTEVVTTALSDPQTALILTYHPPIFSGLKSITLSTPLQRSLLECIATGIPVYTIHTAADNCSQGTNDFIAQGFVTSLEGRTFGGKVEVKAIKEGVKPDNYKVEGIVGTGRKVDMSPMGLGRDEVIEVVKKQMGLKHLQVAWASSGTKFIQTVAICVGSGSGVLKDVQADLYVTGELGHHEILAANAKGIHVILCNHSASERPWLSEFAPRLQASMNNLKGIDEYEVIVSEADREPLEFA